MNRRGFPCPCCAGKMRVLCVRKPTRHMVRRYRQCRECGFRLVTEERPRKEPIGRIPESVS
jgi:hypothetical protein